MLTSLASPCQHQVAGQNAQADPPAASNWSCASCSISGALGSPAGSPAQSATGPASPLCKASEGGVQFSAACAAASSAASAATSVVICERTSAHTGRSDPLTAVCSKYPTCTTQPYFPCYQVQCARGASAPRQHGRTAERQSCTSTFMPTTKRPLSTLRWPHKHRRSVDLPQPVPQNLA